MGVNRAVLIKSQDANDLTGGVEAADAPIPEATEGRVLVRVHLRPVNPVRQTCARKYLHWACTDLQEVVRALPKQGCPILDAKVPRPTFT